LSDIFTTFRKTLEPLRDRPRTPLPSPKSLPPLPEAFIIPPQSSPFVIPDHYDDVLSAILKPLDLSKDLPNPPEWPISESSDTPVIKSAHPFQGGESNGLERLDYLFSSGAMSGYKDTRNGLIGADFSTKLSAYLAIGCITSRQIHAEMVLFEDGEPTATEPSKSSLNLEELKKRMDRWRNANGFGKGENAGTAGVRFELLWRDYFRLVARKYGAKMFYRSGLRGTKDRSWKELGGPKDAANDLHSASAILERFRSGRTGIGLIDASQRELYLTGYASNRVRQNVASFLSKHMNVDWRLGAEWYECMLVDYDSASNWGNWQYVAGVGNDPREGRLFNPVKQALDYDSKGEYIKAWVSELRDVDLGARKEGDSLDDEKLMGLYQAWRLPDSEKKRLGLHGVDFVENPLIRIQFSIGKKPRGGGGGPSSGRGRGFRGRGPPRGGPGRGRGRWRMGEMDKANEGREESR
jgi:deoxyribodipyrimidine photo-lyase